MTYHQFAVDIFPTKLELSVPHKSDDIIFPGSLAAGYAIYQNLDHFGFIEIAITYMNYFENSDMARNLKSAIRQNWSKFRAYLQYCRGQENLDVS